MFESHVTIVGMSELEFLTICKNRSFKPIIIIDDDGLKQMMTAKFHKTTDINVAMNEMEEIAKCFSGVVRKKLEEIVSKNKPSKLGFKYQEYHSKFLVPSSRAEDFFGIVKSMGGHTSFNELNGIEYRFVTTRNPELHDKLVNEIINLGFELLGTIREHVIYDSNPHYDNNWHCFECPLKRIS